MRVLIVEDDRAIAYALKKGLEQEAFAVDIVDNGEDGYASAAAFAYDLCILDVMLPERDGLTVIRQLRSESVRTPILMLSARDHVSDKVAGLTMGADDYLAKPFSFDELLARVQALLRRSPVIRSEILTLNDLEVNMTTRLVARAEQPIALTSKEFAILEYLLRHKGVTRSKENIMDHVWSFDADVLPHTVEVFIMHLRQKIDKPFPGLPLIETVRGFGYRVRADDV